MGSIGKSGSIYSRPTTYRRDNKYMYMYVYVCFHIYGMLCFDRFTKLNSIYKMVYYLLIRISIYLHNNINCPYLLLLRGRNVHFVNLVRLLLIYLRSWTDDGCTQTVTLQLCSAIKKSTFLCQKGRIGSRMQCRIWSNIW